jgi:hypothetical protein
VSRSIWGPGFKKKLGFSGALTIGDDVGVLFTWSVRISKYGKPCKYSQKIRKKGGKYTDMYCCGVVFTWSVHISKYRNDSNTIGEN